MKYFVLAALSLATASRLTAQNPTSMPSSSVGHIASRFLPADLITRLSERPEGLVDSEHGRGVFVRRRPAVRRLA